MSQCVVVANLRHTSIKPVENRQEENVARAMAKEQNVVKALHHVTSVVLHARIAVTTALLRERLVTSVVLHAKTAVMTALLRVITVMSVVLHAKVANMPARAALKVANHSTAKVTASVSRLTRMTSSHCVVEKEIRNNLKAYIL